MNSNKAYVGKLIQSVRMSVLVSLCHHLEVLLTTRGAMWKHQSQRFPILTVLTMSMVV